MTSIYPAYMAQAQKIKSINHPFNEVISVFVFAPGP